MAKRDLPGEISSSDIIKILERHGWVEEPLLATGHRQFSKPDGSCKVTVQHPEKFGTRRNSLVFRSILRQMGISRKTFARWYYGDDK